jgi:hypothetical protein
MRQLRKYIRKIILEGMKTADMLPDGIVIVIDDDPDYEQIQIYYASDLDGDYTALSPMDGIYGSVTFEKTEDYGQCLDSMRVNHSAATPGWGPLLYDIAIEYASLKHNGLMPDRFDVSMDANYVWNFYNRRRGDVTKKQLDDPYDRLTPEPEDNCNQDVAERDENAYDWKESALSKTYSKSPVLINKLKKSGKLVML